MKIPERPPTSASTARLLADAMESSTVEQIFAASRPVDGKGRYLHWDELRRRQPPDGLDHQQWWAAITLARRSIGRDIPLRAVDGTPFRFCNVDPIQERVHRIDQQASGQLLADEVITTVRGSDRYLVSSLEEEAITSSQLEGASTTRAVAKELLATGRRPRDRSEQMIVNNFEAMMFARDLRDRDVAPEDVLDLHRIVTHDTLDDPRDAGRLQSSSDERIGVYWDHRLLHRPPPAAELEARLDALCEFANGSALDGFIHPVVRAVVTHFWLAFDHPFVDGNGRTARALFYWVMLREGYWLAQYLSISSILRRRPAKYARSYLYAETDEYDVTYFVVDQLDVIERAIESLREYLVRKMAETREIEGMLHGSTRLNNRQLVIVHDALRSPGEPFTIAAQARRHRVTYESARSDLLDLEELGLFTKQRLGKKYVFHALPDLDERLRTLG